MLKSPEWSLHAPGELSDQVGHCADEGVGTGYDSGFPHAYVERHFEVDDDAPDPAAWFDEHLRSLGWLPEERDHRSMLTWRREPDESITLTSWGPPPEHVAERFRAVARTIGGDDIKPSGRSFRLSYQIDGSWPDGSREARFK
jgi:hypothetical protein